ncbi:DUF418 domain-containing protein [Paenibacillus donghaensis]|uniref:DUF418 domain-containing protein n=1 Tax=Paenibacillus donghaensis TaxID=414771 RepID=UPI0018841158|nr:DUF418 domain-containing protein [Paenibacillus donghaensis]MBE9918031.1 DUF418 domain-containing protein [Paenibacillus donghaensis]
MQPSVSSKERIVSLDIIRGMALFGILLINIKGYRVVVEGMALPDIAGFNEVIQTFTTVFIEKKFYSIFSFLFGAGFYLFASRAESRGDKPLRLFSRRLLALLLIGVAHLPIFWGSILFYYALIGFLLLPFYRASVKTTLWIGGGLLVLHLAATGLQFAISYSELAIAQVLSFLTNDCITIFLMFLSGCVAAKAGWIGKTGEHIRSIRKLFLLLLPIAAGLSVWMWIAEGNADPLLSSIVALSAIPMAYCYLSGLLLLLEHRSIARLFSPVGKLGRMALTNYVAQSLIGVALLDMFGINFPTPVEIVLVAIVIFVIQVVISVVWLRFFRMGPLEKLWRIMTYGRRAIGRTGRTHDSARD